MVPVAIAQLPTMGSIKWKWLYSVPLGNSSKWLRHGIISTAWVYIDGIHFETEIIVTDDPKKYIDSPAWSVCKFLVIFILNIKN